MEPLVTLLVFLVIVGLVVWLIDKYIPMAEPFKTIFRILIVVAFCVYILNMVGIHVPFLHK
jgi:hypothetical protein